jgi:hypothetical protein
MSGITYAMDTGVMRATDSMIEAIARNEPRLIRYVERMAGRRDYKKATAIGSIGRAYLIKTRYGCKIEYCELMYGDLIKVGEARIVL